MRFPQQHAVPAFIAIFIFAPLFWMALDRVPPYVITNGRLNPTKIAPNEWYTIEWDVKTVRACPGTKNSRVTTYIVDVNGGLNIYAATQGGFVEGIPLIHKEKKLLAALPAGPAKYFSEVCYPCNPLQDKLNWPICFPTPMLEFEILEEK